ncbi:hypothetical protein O6H91_19G062100 [Diphasiastrum complanatum]|uniref:Uncharacterized protein n=1 Tax=Diphasiastrum complanatum TaxID=34168 RepID=A0ACC2AX68_DIPCM|nr:hypothetical protein O6H91_19G062100 [Diphasiastrum complanatum]
MARCKSALRWKRFNLTAAYSHTNGPDSGKSQCSCHSVVSDADSVDVIHQVAEASSGISSSNAHMARAKACHETSGRRRTCYLALRTVKHAMKPTNTHKSNIERAVWTEAKHRSYLNSMEEEFLRHFIDKDRYAVQRSVNMVHHEDYSDDDCVESLPTEAPSCFETCEKAFGSWNRPSQHPVQKIPDLCTSKSKLVASVWVKESNLKLCRNEGEHRIEKCSDFLAGDHQGQTKKRAAPTEEKFLDLELRLGDFRTRLFRQFNTQRLCLEEDSYCNPK